MKQAIQKKSTSNYSPRENFYQYVNHEWLDKNDIPASESWWGTFNVLIQDTLSNIKQLCEEVQSNGDVSKGSVIQLVRDFYFSGMNMEVRNKLGKKPAKKLLSQIGGIKDVHDFIMIVALLHTFGFAPFWYVHVDEDAKKVNWNTLYFEQSGLGMPDRDYYLKDDEHLKTIRQHYISYISRMFGLVGYSLSESNDAASVIMEIEQRLAMASFSAEKVREVEKNYHAFNLLKIKKYFPLIDWDIYFQTLGIQKIKKFVISQPSFISEVNALLNSVSIDNIK